VSEAAVDRRSRASGARSAKPKRGAGYAVYDPVGQKIGRAEEVFVNRDGEPVYVRVRIGIFSSRTVLIPVQFVESDDEGKSLVLK
jgi:PRC-barrel domain